MVRDLRNIDGRKKEKQEEQTSNDDEESDNSFSVMPMILGVVIVVIAIVVGTIMLSSFDTSSIQTTPTQLSTTYTGTLLSITYEQNYYGKTTSSKLIFTDGSTFSLSEDVHYALGLKYIVNFTYHKVSNGDSIIDHIDKIELAQ